MWLVGSGVSAPVRVDLVKLRAASTDARPGLLVGLGEVASIGRWVELRSDPPSDAEPQELLFCRADLRYGRPLTSRPAHTYFLVANLTGR